MDFTETGVVHLYPNDIEEKGVATIKKVSISAAEERRANMYYSARSNYGLFAVKQGEYVQLFIKGHGLMMSDTHMERKTNYDFVSSANGRVLIAGLGVGLIIKGIIDRKDITEIVVIEKYQDVIDLVLPKIKHKKLKVINADIFEWKPEKGELFDSIYFDIWADICEDNLDEMKTLHKKYSRALNKSNSRSFMDSWMKGHLTRQKRRSR